jgi:hypothetical protein
MMTESVGKVACGQGPPLAVLLVSTAPCRPHATSKLSSSSHSLEYIESNVTIQKPYTSSCNGLPPSPPPGRLTLRIVPLRGVGRRHQPTQVPSLRGESEALHGCGTATNCLLHSECHLCPPKY